MVDVKGKDKTVGGGEKIVKLKGVLKTTRIWRLHCKECRRGRKKD